MGVGSSGCQDVDWGMGPAQHGPADRTIAASQKPPVAPTGTPAGRRTDPTSTSDELAFHQLVLFSKPAPAQSPPGLYYVRLKQASARKVGQLLASLYVPSGPSGTRYRYTLVYPSSRESEAAAKWAERLDVPEVVDAGASSPAALENVFSFAVGLYHGVPKDFVKAVSHLRAAETNLTRCLHAEELSGPVRWGAGMIAGAILADRFYEYDEAESRFLDAQLLTPPGSYEQMAALYARARGHVQNGMKAAARELLVQIVGQFGMFRTSEVFGRAREMLGELGG